MSREDMEVVAQSSCDPRAEGQKDKVENVKRAKRKPDVGVAGNLLIHGTDKDASR